MSGKSQVWAMRSGDTKKQPNTTSACNVDRAIVDRNVILYRL